MAFLPSPITILSIIIISIVFDWRVINGARASDSTIKFYVQQQFGVNELATVPPARPPAAGTSTGFGLQVVFEYPITATNPTNTSAPIIGFLRGTSVAVNNTEGSTTFVVRSVVHYGNDGSTWVQEGEANFTSGAWELAVVGGTGGFRKASGYSIGRTVSFTRTSTTPIIVSYYEAHL